MLGLSMMAWELSARASPWVVYHGLMYLTMGVSFILAFAFPLQDNAASYGIFGLLAMVVAWSGWKGIQLLRIQSSQGREEA